MNIQEFQPENNFAVELDSKDLLRKHRDEFYFPEKNGKKVLYFSGNSLGLQPKTVKDYIDQELQDWATFGVAGHFEAKYPWVSYHELLTEQSAQIMGATSEEVVVMNSLTVNLHLMLVSFYRPNNKRYKILIEPHAFPSDVYACKSQLNFHGYSKGLCTFPLRQGELIVLDEDIERYLKENGNSISLILLGAVNYYTGQLFDIEKICSLAKEHGCIVGLDLAHAAGNIPLKLHDWGADFAVWCSYKYLNGGPGAVGGCFVHQKHSDKDLPRFAGWWGHDKQTRFLMGDEFRATNGAQGWQLSNAPVFSMAALRASLDIFAKVGMDKLREKSILLTQYLEYLLAQKCSEFLSVITPTNPEQRGAQLTLQLNTKGKDIYQKLLNRGIECDWREPAGIRIAPVPLYNSFLDVWRFVDALKQVLEE